jgi:hypothetical protein
MAETSLIEISERQVPTIRETLDGIWSSLEKSAAESISLAATQENATLTEYSAIEQRALLYGEMLNQSKGLSFAEVMVQGRIVSTMERESLASVHPAGYRSLDELARDQGIGASELSQIRDMTQTIFPWIQTNIGTEPSELWQEVGKSKLRELTPLLKRVITGEEARGSVETSYDNLIAGINRVAEESNETLTDDDRQKNAVEQLITHGMTMTNADLRQTIRADRTPSLEPVILTRWNPSGREPARRNYVIVEVSDDQLTMLSRRLHGYWDPVRVSATTPTDVETIQILRRIREGG